MTPLIQILKADLELEAKATPGKWRVAMHGYNVKSDLTGTEHDGDYFENVCAVPGCARAVPKAVQQFQDDAEEIATARNHHKPYVVALLKIAEWKCEVCEGRGETCYCECHSSLSSRMRCIHCKPEYFITKPDPYVRPCVCVPIRTALAELAEALGVQE